MSRTRRTTSSTATTAATADATAPAAPAYEPSTLYAVTLAHTANSPIGPLSAGVETELRGWICNAIADDIADAKPV